MADDVRGTADRPGSDPAPSGVAVAVRRPGLAWSWAACLRGVLYALPALAVGWRDPAQAMAWAVGVLPAAAVGLAPARRGRLVIVLLGLCVGAAMVVGALLAGAGWWAVAGVFALAVAAALLAARARVGVLALFLGVPMVGVGLSFDGVADALGAAALILAGSVYACLVAQAWPSSAAPTAPRPARLPLRGRREALEYGLRLGGAGAAATAVGLAWAPTHPGWPAAAALLVMRPGADTQRLRSAGRVLAVLTGAGAAITLLAAGPAAWGYALVAVAVVALAAATQGSRWYVMPAFSTMLMLFLLVQADPAAEGSRVAERIGATLVGVALAYTFGLTRRPDRHSGEHLRHARRPPT